MKTKRYSDAQIMGILKQAESGVPVSELCREHGMSNASFYKWRAKFGGMDVSMKSLTEENRRLKRMYAEMSMQNDLLKEVLGKSEAAIPAEGDGRESGRQPWCRYCAGLPGVSNQ